MTEPELSPRERAALTKQRRTRDRLAKAAHEAFETHGRDTRIEDVVSAAQVSTPTFYNFYRSLNELAHEALVGRLNDVASPQAESIVESVYNLEQVIGGNPALTRAAMLGRIEADPEQAKPRHLIRLDYQPEPGQDQALDAVGAAARVLHCAEVEQLASEAFLWNWLHMVALLALDEIARGKPMPAHDVRSMLQLLDEE